MPEAPNSTAGASDARKPRRRRVTTPPPPGTDPTPTPEPERHESTENDERLRADKPPHY
ncbi:MAG TPA: hypothetical protein VHX87_07160 [Galbitalea sp.]|nr:hypothetical protein [Galbitalea sp.]